MSIESLNRAIDIAGSQKALGALIGKSQQTISYWVTELQKVPGEDVLLVENAVQGQVTRYELRPDLYPFEQ